MDRRHTLRLIGVLILLALPLACAKARIGSSQSYVGEDETLAFPPLLMVYDFAVSADDVVEDVFGSAFAVPADSSKETQEARRVAWSLSQQLVEKLRKQGIRTTHASPSSVPPVNALVIKGEFVTVDKGSRVKRMTIGLGAGASKLEARVQAYQATGYGLRRLAQAEVSATGSKAPGMAIPVGAGAAAGQAATSAIVSGGMNVTREATGGLEADAGRMADQIAERVVAFYQRQGWI